MAEPEREDRILMEIVVDCYNEQERAVGWCCYLEGKMQFPFMATCIDRHAVSPLQVKKQVEVIGMASDECEREMFVTIRWNKDRLAVPLSQLKPIPATDEQTKQAVEDWHYWVNMGYDF